MNHSHQSGFNAVEGRGMKCEACGKEGKAKWKAMTNARDELRRFIERNTK
jgi:hypothetical protein